MNLFEENAKAELLARAKIEAEAKAKVDAEEAETDAIETVEDRRKAAALLETELSDQGKAISATKTKPQAVIVGRIEVVEEGGENFKTDLGMLVVFNSPEELRAALNNGTCAFSFGEEEVEA